MPSQIAPEPTLELRGENKDAFLLAYDIYAPKIYRFIYYKTSKNQTLSEELTQQTFCKTWEYIQTKNQSIKQVQAFLYRTARHLIIDHYRASRNGDIALNDTHLKTNGQPRWQEKIEAKVDVNIIEAALDNIAEQYKEIITLRFVEELSIEEISQILNKNKNNVYVVIHRALQALRDQLKVYQASADQPAAKPKAQLEQNFNLQTA